MNSTRDLRTQADIVERALNKKITCMDEVRQRLENDLKSVCLQQFFLYYLAHNFFIF